MRFLARLISILIFFLISSATLSTGCGRSRTSSETPSTSKNVFGTDNRTTLNSGSAPWKSIGVLDSGCTGTLVGKKLVLTAAHCVVNEVTGAVNESTTFFRPGFQGSTSSDKFWIGYMWYGTNRPADDRGQDWAVLLLEKNAGDRYGWMSLDQISFAESLPSTVSLAGYSDDLNGKLSIHEECYIHDVEGDRLLNDCDSRSGISGAPILAAVNGRKSIVGIAVSEYRQGQPGSVVRDIYEKSFANVAISSSSFLQTVTELRKGLEMGLPWNLPSGVLQAINPNVPPTPDGGGDGPGDTDPTPTPTPTPTRQMVSPDQLMRESAQIEARSQQMAMEFQWLAIKAQQGRYYSLESTMTQAVKSSDQLTNLMSDYRLGFRNSSNVMSQLPLILASIKQERENLAQFLTQPGTRAFYQAASVNIYNVDALFFQIERKVYRR